MSFIDTYFILLELFMPSTQMRDVKDIKDLVLEQSVFY
nr:MAG TPA: hypothetical protein [Microviridae sp.]